MGKPAVHFAAKVPAGRGPKPFPPGKSCRIPDSHSRPLPAGRPLAAVIVLGSAAAYALLLLHAGFVVSIALMIFVSMRAHPQFRLKEAVLLSIGLTALAAVLFIGGLGLQVPIWPQWD